jgi:hypothetical protein
VDSYCVIKRCCAEFKLQALPRVGSCAKRRFFERGWRLLFKQQFAGATGRLYNCLDERDPEFSFFEFEDAVDCAACGGGDRIL